MVETCSLEMLLESAAHKPFEAKSTLFLDIPLSSIRSEMLSKAKAGLKVWFVVLAVLASCLATALEVSKADYIKLIVSSYVHGFKEFDTSVTTFNDGSVSVGIYYDVSTQSSSRAYQLQQRFEKQVPLLFGKYDWGKGIRLRVSVYGEDRSRGY